ncbi:MAG: hypothetical protein ACTSU5_12460 [Promethearchaeota archaeon]
MFEDVKEEWDRLFDSFRERFNEEVGVMFSVFSSEELGLEVDLFVGEDTGHIRGARVFQGDIDEDEGDGEDVEGGGGEVVYYDLVAVPGASIEGSSAVEVDLAWPDTFKEEGKEYAPTDVWVTLAIFTKDGTPTGEVTGVFATQGVAGGEKTPLVDLDET